MKVCMPGLSSLFSFLTITTRFQCTESFEKWFHASRVTDLGYNYVCLFSERVCFRSRSFRYTPIGLSYSMLMTKVMLSVSSFLLISLFIWWAPPRNSIPHLLKVDLGSYAGLSRDYNNQALKDYIKRKLVVIQSGHEGSRCANCDINRRET